MFGSSALEFAIGLSFVYLMLSLAVTALQEGLASIFRRRARTLAAGLQNLLRDGKMVDELYGHPLIQGLHLGKRRPSYIPSRLFTLALLDTITPAGETPTPENVAAALSRPTGGIKSALAVIAADAEGDFEKFKEGVEVWFNHGMERVGGWYKRYTQGILVLIAIPLTIAINADSIVIGHAVWRDPTLRAALVAEAGKAQAAPPIQLLEQVRLPIGWAPREDGAPYEWKDAIARHWLGWGITVLAISLGAPFWFDLLNKFTAVRGDGKAPEEKQKNPKREQPPLGPGETPSGARREAERNKPDTPQPPKDRG